MSETSDPRRQPAAAGTVIVLLAESTALPAGFLVAATLTRSLGPEGYGRYSLAGALVATIEWIMVALLSRATIKLVAEAGAWQSVAAAAFRAHLGVGLVAAAMLWALAGPIGTGLGDPLLAPALRLFGFELPFFAAAVACRNVLTGLASYRQHATAGAVRWLGRLGFIALFVRLGWSLEGAILGNIAGVALAWVVAQAFLGSAPLRRTDFPVARLLVLAVPVFILMLNLRLFDRLGLFALKALGGSTADAGFYGAAQNLLMIVGILNMSVSPILISSVAARHHAGDEGRARRTAETGIRLGIWILPFTAIVAGASGEVVRLLFGASFAPAGPVLRLLILSASGLTLVSLSSALLIARARPWPAVWLTAGLLPFTLLGYAILVPRSAGVGAAAVTLVSAWLAAALGLAMVCRSWPLNFPSAALVRSAAVSAVVYAMAATWSTDGALVIVKSMVLSLLIIAVALQLREFTRGDLDWAFQGSPARAPDGAAAT